MRGTVVIKLEPITFTIAVTVFIISTMGEFGVPVAYAVPIISATPPATWWVIRRRGHWHAHCDICGKCSVATGIPRWRPARCGREVLRMFGWRVTERGWVTCSGCLLDEHARRGEPSEAA